MKNSLKILSTLIIFVGISCQKNQEKAKRLDTTHIEKTVLVKKEENNEERVFFKKNEIEFTDSNDKYISTKNEVILFRPTEFNFGRMVEDSQSNDLVELDAKFEELTNSIIDTFKNTKDLPISICEKSYIEFSVGQDTLYFNTNKQLYGILLCKYGEFPVFKNASEINLISQIKNHYNL